jgi:hypothetical protein
MDVIMAVTLLLVVFAAAANAVFLVDSRLHRQA